MSRLVLLKYQLSLNIFGDASGKDEVYANHKQEENHLIPVSPSISLLE